MNKTKRERKFWLPLKSKKALTIGSIFSHIKNVLFCQLILLCKRYGWRKVNCIRNTAKCEPICIVCTGCLAFNWRSSTLCGMAWLNSICVRMTLKRNWHNTQRQNKGITHNLVRFCLLAVCDWIFNYIYICISIPLATDVQCTVYLCLLSLFQLLFFNKYYGFFSHQRMFFRPFFVDIDHSAYDKAVWYSVIRKKTRKAI